MRDKTFRKLINLYLDSEITPRSLRRLRREIQRDAERKRIFDDYVQLHWALRLADFDHEVMFPETEARSWRVSRAGLAFGAAAAAVLLAFVSALPRIDGIQEGNVPVLASSDANVQVVQPVDLAAVKRLPDLTISFASDEPTIVSRAGTPDLLSLSSLSESSELTGPGDNQFRPRLASELLRATGPAVYSAQASSSAGGRGEFMIQKVSLP